MKRVILLIIFLTVSSHLFSQNQSNMYVRGDINGWGDNSMTRNDLGTDTWVVTITESETDGTSDFKFADTDDWSGTDWSRGAAVTIGSKTTWYDPNLGNGSFSQTSGKYYTFTIKDVADDNNSEGYIFEFSQTPISISSVSNVGNGLASTAYTVTVGLSGTPDANERVYIRYTADNWSSSSVVEGDPSSNSIDIDIPGQSAAATVKYYAFTSIAGISNSDADLATISFDNNSGNNYSYYVESGSATISGNAGFRMMSTPVASGTYSDLLAELWTQGMTNSDAPEASGDNVWIWTVGAGGAGSWAVVSNLGNTMTAGAGILVYAFADNNNDGTDDLPVTLSVSGSESSGDVRYPAIGNIEQNRYGFAGNPYYSTIDWDDVAESNISATVYIHDDAKSGGAGYISWNGSSGDVTNGLIAPFQGFVVTASGGAGYITIQEADKSTSAGSFYRTLDGDNEGSSYLEFSTAEGGYSKSWFSFREDGIIGEDDRDANKLMPIMASSRLVSLTHNGDNSLDINNLPFDQEGTVSVPLDVMSLILEDQNYVTGTVEVNMSWNLEDLPEHIELTLVDNLTGEMVYLGQEMSHTFTTEPKGSFSATYDDAVAIYPLVGEARFELQLSYGALDNAPAEVMPMDYALSPVYPNPFNPSATVRFDVPEVSRVELQVYDVTGALVETLLNDRMTPGQHQYTWNPQGLATGTYFLRLNTANQTFTQKVTYVK